MPWNFGTDRQATLQPSRPYLTLSASGPKGLCVLISYVMRDSCEYSMIQTGFMLIDRGAIGAWIKNVELPPDEAIDTQHDGAEMPQEEGLNIVEKKAQ
jgi:hypothetical protein